MDIKNVTFAYIKYITLKNKYITEKVQYITENSFQRSGYK